MKPFEYIAAHTIAEACSVLAEHGSEARILAGGTDLLIELRRGSRQAPRVVLDISAVAELGGIAETDGIIALGPLTTHADLVRSEAVNKWAPLLSCAAVTIGSPQIRARGTVGGNLMNAAACADTVPPLIALGATVTLHSRAGHRELPLADLFLKPYQTKAKPDELLVAVRFPKLGPAARSAFIKLGRRNALAISRLSVAAILEVGVDGKITEARIVPGSAFATWQRVTAAEQMLIGQQPDAKLFAAAGKRVSEEMIKATGRRWSTEYKEPALAVLVRRALEGCLGPVGSARRADLSTATQALPPLPTLTSPRTEQQVPELPLLTRLLPYELTPGAPPSGGSRSVLARPDARVMAPPVPAPAGVPAVQAPVPITTTINARPLTLTVPANTTLLDLLRDHLGLSGTKCGCEIGECGACTVLLDGHPVNACLVLAPQIHGRHVLTVEGLARDGQLHPLQQAFLDHDAVHCGFCTPGMLLSAKALLDYNPRATDSQIRTAISGNLCRCTGYQQIVEAIANCVPHQHIEAKS